MEKQLEEFAKAAKGAACETMKNYGGSMANLAAWAYAGGPKVGTGVTIALGIAQWAAKNNCEWDPDKQGGGVDPGSATGCRLSDEFCLAGLYRHASGSGAYSFSNAIEVDYFNYTWLTNPDGPRILQISYRYRDNSGWVERTTETAFDATDITTFEVVILGNDGKCLEPLAPAPAPPPTYQHTTEEGCVLNVNFKSLVQDNDGNVGGAWQIEPANETRENGGGIISGCNFSPVIYYDGGGGNGGGGDRVFPIPTPTPPGDDWWQDLLKAALATAAGNILASSLRELVKPMLPPSEFLFTAPCDKDEQGKQLQVLYQLPDQDYQSRVVSQQAVIMEILQQHLNWKTPVCFGNNEKGAYFRSLAFESTPDPDNNYQRTIKRFRYRSNSPCDVRQLAAHWRDFVWNTGPVIVKHTGSALGSPQVWAASVDEGQRVIQHAGREAGVDPDQVGKWTVGSVDSPRYGVRAAVRLKEVDGIWAATARIGPSDWPPSSKVF